MIERARRTRGDPPPGDRRYSGCHGNVLEGVSGAVCMMDEACWSFRSALMDGSLVCRN